MSARDLVKPDVERGGNDASGPTSEAYRREEEQLGPVPRIIAPRKVVDALDDLSTMVFDKFAKSCRYDITEFRFRYERM